MIVTIGILLAGFLFGLLLKGRVKLPTSAITMLASETTTVEVGLDVILLSYLQQVQWLLNHILQNC